MTSTTLRNVWRHLRQYCKPFLLTNPPVNAVKKRKSNVPAAGAAGAFCRKRTREPIKQLTAQPQLHPEQMLTQLLPRPLLSPALEKKPAKSWRPARAVRTSRTASPRTTPALSYPALPRRFKLLIWSRLFCECKGKSRPSEKSSAQTPFWGSFHANFRLRRPFQPLFSHPQ